MKMRFTLKLKIAGIPSVIMLLMMTISGCEDGKTTDQQQDEGTSQDLISLTADQFSSSGMVLGKLETHSFDEKISVNGLLDVPPENRASVSVYYGGYVKAITILPGQRIKRGETLFTLENPEYIKMQQEFLESKGQLAYLKNDYERQKELAEQNISSQKNYLKAQADYASMLSKYESLKKQLSLININTKTLVPDNMRSAVPIHSPINGFITAVNAERGKYLNPGDVATTITNTDHLHLELNVYEKDFNKLTLDQPILFKLQNDVGKIYRAHIYLVGRTINPEQRTINVHGHLENEEDGRSFAPGMYVEAEIIVNQEKGLSLPVESVVNIENKYFVLLKKSSQGDSLFFTKKEVKVGDTDGSYIQILNHQDFSEDDSFLSKGAFNLITE